jgi:hypothetical protein
MSINLLRATSTHHLLLKPITTSSTNQFIRMASSSAPKQKQLGDGGETDHGIPVNERRAQIISDIQAVRHHHCLAPSLRWRERRSRGMERMKLTDSVIKLF